MKQSRNEVFFGYAILVIGVITAIYPFASIVMLSLTPSGERTGGLALPSRLTLENYADAWVQGGFAQAMISSAIVALGVVVGSVVLSALAGYAFATMRFPGKLVLSAFLLVGLVLPYEGIIVPLYYQLQSMGLLNTYWALILPQIATSVSLGIFWMRTAYASLPEALSDAARVDGCGRFATLWRVYLPLSAPAIGTLATLLFLFTRNLDPTVMAAAAVLVAIPIIIVYAVLQRRFIAGIASGAVKE